MNQDMSQATYDPRSEELMRAHSVIAEEVRSIERARTRELRAAHPELFVDAMPEEGEAVYEYRVRVEYTSIMFIMTLKVEFFDAGGKLLCTFKGAAPSGLGGGVLWGSAKLNYTINHIHGWNASFWFHFNVGVGVISWRGGSWEDIGSCVATGVGTGIVGLVGPGGFCQKKPVDDSALAP